MKKYVLSMVVFALTLMNVNAMKLKVGTNADFPPFEFYDKKHKMIGLDIDLANAVAKKAGYDGVEMVDIKFDGLIATLITKKIDMIAAGLVITEERLKAVDFTKPYTKHANVIIVKKSENGIKGLNDLESKKIGVQIATTSADIAKTVKNAEVIEYSSSDELAVNLLNNKIDAVIQIESVARYSIKEGKLPLKVIGEDLTSKTKLVAFAINKENKELLNKINKALDEVNKDGTYNKIYEKWFGKK